MARFIAAGYARYINLDDVTEIYLQDGSWYAQPRSGDRPQKLGEGEYQERKIAMATATIVPAAPDEVLHRFWLSDKDRSLVHDKDRIIAWIIDPPYPTPVTASGPVECGWHRGDLVAIQQPSGRYDDVVNEVYADEEEVHRALKKLAAEDAAEKAMVDA